MKSRLVARLDAAISAERNPIMAACLRAERSCALSRQGQLDEARRAIDELQVQFAWQPQPAVSAWLNLAEGINHYYRHERDSAAALDLIQRAHALSRAAQMAPLHALAAAWLAHMCLVRDDMTRMAQHLVEALQQARADHHGARSRACLIAANAYHLAGSLERALPWYTRARVHAVADGDEATLASLMHNQSSLRSHAVRLAALFDGDSLAHAEDARIALLGSESSGHYDIGTDNRALASTVPLEQAMRLTTCGRWKDALALFETWFDAARREGFDRLEPCFLADMALCRLELGDADGALRDAAEAQTALTRPCDVDDRAIAQAQLAHVYDLLGRPDEAALLRERARRDLAAHEAEQARLLALLDGALGGIDIAGA